MSSPRWLTLTLGIAGALAGATGCMHRGSQPITASGGGPASPISQAVTTPPASRVVDVHAALFRGALTTCSYRALVTGTLRVTAAPSGSSNPDAASYEPNLTVTSSVVCADTRTSRDETQVLRGTTLTRAQMLDALRERSSIPVNRGDHVCTVRPGWSFDGEQIYGYQVTDTCGAPIGGGPRTVEMTAQANNYPHVPAPVAHPGWHRRFPHPASVSHPTVTQQRAAAPRGPRLCPCPAEP